jgi:hypothetical protein
VSGLTQDERAELEALRARVAALEQELVEQAARTNAITAAAQERLYWLDRWHLDLNALMARRGAAEARAFVRLLRGPLRRIRRFKRRLLG